MKREAVAEVVAGIPGDAVVADADEATRIASAHAALKDEMRRQLREAQLHGTRERVRLALDAIAAAVPQQMRRP